METMKALVFKEPWEINLEEVPVPQVHEKNQVLIKIAECGICGSDIKILEGKHAYNPNIVLGHEFNGTVVDVGSNVTAVQVGDRVALDNNPRCGVCDFCRTGVSNQCTELKNRTMGVYKDGGYAEYCVAPEDVCFKLPDEIDDTLGTQVETLGTVLNGMGVIQMQPWDTVLVLGCGPIGYLFGSLAKNIAARAMITEIDPFRFNIAKGLGIEAFNPDKQDIEGAICELTAGRKADIVIDAVGDQLENALKYVTPGGKILAFGMNSNYNATIHPYYVTRHAVKILGTYIGQHTCIPAIRVFQSGKIDMDAFFTDTVPLEQGADAFLKLGLDLSKRKNVAKQAMKLTFKP